MNLIRCALVLGTLLCLSSARAQTAPTGNQEVSMDLQTPPETTGVPDPTNAELAAELERLKTETSTWQKVVKALPRISGYMQLGYLWSEESSSFFIKSARLSFAGDITKKIEYLLQFELASPKIIDVFVRYRAFDQLNFQLGQNKLPFSIENTDYLLLKFEFIEYPISLYKLMGFTDMCGLSAGGRDLGAMIYGGFIKREGYSILNYDFGVFNGEGINCWDKNKSKDIVGRVMIKPIAGLNISGSYYWGEYGKDYLKRIRYGAGACYDKGPVVVRGEYLHGTTGELRSEGWYAMAGWRMTKSLQPALRYDTFVENLDKPSSTRQTNYTAALSWQPFKYLRCQLDYTYEDYNAPEAKNRNVATLMVTGIF